VAEELELPIVEDSGLLDFVHITGSEGSQINDSGGGKKDSRIHFELVGVAVADFSHCHDEGFISGETFGAGGRQGSGESFFGHGEGSFDRLDDGAATSSGEEIPGEAWLGQVAFQAFFGAKMMVLSQSDQDIVMDDFECGQISFSGFFIAPEPELAEDGQGPRGVLEAMPSFDAPAAFAIGIGGSIAERLDLSNGPFAALAVPLGTLGHFKFRSQKARYCGEVVDIAGGIDFHFLGERTSAPVGFLAFFVDGIACGAFNQCSVADFIESQDLGSHHGIKDLTGAESKVPLKQAQVVIGAMKEHHGDLLKGFNERGKGEIAEGIDQVGFAVDSDLDQTGFFVVMMETVGFGINGDDEGLLKLVNEGEEVVLGANVVQVEGAGKGVGQIEEGFRPGGGFFDEGCEGDLGRCWLGSHLGHGGVATISGWPREVSLRLLRGKRRKRVGAQESGFSRLGNGLRGSGGHAVHKNSQIRPIWNFQ
jgi:hypothetical protein